MTLCHRRIHRSKPRSITKVVEALPRQSKHTVECSKHVVVPTSWRRNIIEAVEMSSRHRRGRRITPRSITVTIEACRQIIVAAIEAHHGCSNMSSSQHHRSSRDAVATSPLMLKYTIDIRSMWSRHHRGSVAIAASLIASPWSLKQYDVTETTIRHCSTACSLIVTPVAARPPLTTLSSWLAVHYPS